MLKKTLHYLANINFRIAPLKNLHKTHGTSWHATAHDPQLLLISPFFLKGWYYVELKVKYHNDRVQTAKLYPNYGDGYQKEYVIEIPHRESKATYKVIYLPQKVKELRFDPVETQVNFTIEHFKIYRIPKIEAIRIILKRISHLHPSHNDKSTIENKALLIHQRKKNKEEWRTYVLSIYEESFFSYLSDVRYKNWIENEEKKHNLAAKIYLEQLTYKPLVSILLPTYNSNIDYLKQCLESVQKQSYTNWQLCISDDASTHLEHIDLIRQAKKGDNRIDFIQKKVNEHISSNSNTCLSMAEGEYILLLDHDDVLSEYTLLHLVFTLQQNRELQLVYADEDKIAETGSRFDPHFKPEWNQDLLYSQNYIGHPALFKTQTVKKLGGFRLGVEGSQDHDLLLRYTANLTFSQIQRIPKILYHWRAHAESTATDAKAKDYTTQAGIKALNNIFFEQQQKVQISQGELPNTYRVYWPIPKQQPLVTLIVPTYNGYKFLKTCINSILEKTTYSNYEILIVNNRSDCSLTLNFIKNTVQTNLNVKEIKWDYPFNYSAINNFAASHANGTVLGLVNNDVEVISAEWLTEMVSHAIRPEIGCVGSKLYYPNNKIQHAGVILGIGGVAGHAHKYFDKDQPGYFSRLKLTQNLSAVTAACLVVRKDVFDQVNGLDQNNLAIAYNDVDFCLRVRDAGYRNLWTPYAELYHHESMTRGVAKTSGKSKQASAETHYMNSKWERLLLNDPAYNPNLTLFDENFSVK